MSVFVQVSTTTDTRANADKIARVILQERLAACVQLIGPIHSSYWWHGKLENATEWLCIIKAQRKDYRRIESAILRVHSYKIPEVLAFNVDQGNNEYLKWIRNETVGRATRAVARETTR